MVRTIAGALNVHGGKFISRKAEREGNGESTVSALLAAWNDPKVQVLPTDAEIEKAEEIIADTLANMSDETDYGHNVLLIARAGYSTRKSLGIAVSLIACYNRRKMEAVRQEAAAASEYAGTVGKRQVWVATLERFFDVAGDYGCTRICILRTPEGNILKANNISDEVGTTFTFKATVKAHTEYKGRKQTQLSRPAGITRLEAAAA